MGIKRTAGLFLRINFLRWIAMALVGVFGKSYGFTAVRLNSSNHTVPQLLPELLATTELQYNGTGFKEASATTLIDTSSVVDDSLVA
jgi:hypothetical protein